MPFPETNKFGIIENPLLISPFENGKGSGGGTPPIPNNAFLLLDGTPFLLLDGTNLLLLGT